jgi:small subunit ribosomal protein S2
MMIMFNRARCHYGHDAGLRCPWMNEYLFGTRIQTDIINLDKTVPMLKKALNFIAHIAFRKGVILFITRYSQHIPLVERTAMEVGEYSHCKLWNNGSFTDSTRRFGSVIRLPDLCIFLHTHEKLNETHGALNESSKMLIPTIAICDSDIDPSSVTYPIPGNDDSIASIQLYCDLFKKAVLAGKEKRKKLDEQNIKIEFEPV